MSGIHREETRVLVTLVAAILLGSDLLEIPAMNRGVSIRAAVVSARELVKVAATTAAKKTTKRAKG